MTVFIKKDLRKKSLVLPNFRKAIHCIFVLGRFQALHSCFDYVYGGVTKNAGCPSQGSKKSHSKFRHRNFWISFSVDIFARFNDKKSDGLIRTLFQNCGGKTLIYSSKSLNAYTILLINYYLLIASLI